MPNRNLLILGLLLAFAASIGLVLIGGESHATELAPGPLGDAVEVDAPADPSSEPEPAPAVGESTPIPLAAATTTEPERVDTSGWTTGVVKGDIRLATSVLDRLESITVTVEELRNPIDDGKFIQPFRKSVNVERGVGTPIFVVSDIPFSDYPYVVSVYSPGLNGGRATVSITPETPLHQNIVLSITPGRPFTVLVRDQDANPYAQVDVRLFPVGEPRTGRKEHIGTTDGYGSAVFEDVLAGDYRLFVGMRGIPLNEPERVTVQSDARVYGTKIQGQGHTCVVRRGMPLQLYAADRGGYGIAEANVKLQAMDRVKLTVLDAVTDFNGMVDFPHVTPGKWMVQVTKQNYTPWTGHVTITDGKYPDRIDAKMERVR